MKEFIKKHKALSWILGIVGTLIVGGLGSGVWEVVLKPMFSFLGNGVINFLVNKSTNFSNEIYQTISIRSLDRFQAKIYALMVFSLATFLFCLCCSLYWLGKKKLDSDEIQSEDKNKGWVLKNYKNFYCFLIIYFLLALIPMLTYMYDGMKTEFISNKVIYFEYLLKMNGDVLNDQEIKHIESKFSQIRNSDDYGEIVSYLEEVALKNNKNINKNPL